MSIPTKISRKSLTHSPPTSEPDPVKERGAKEGQGVRHSEFLRKAMHMTPGLLAVLLVPLPNEDPLSPLDLFLVSTFYILATAIFLLLESRVRRIGEKNFLCTVLSYPLVVITTLLLFPAYPEFPAVVVIILALGDASAYIIGRQFGKRKLPWNREKSWAGMLGFVAVSAPLASFAYWCEAAHPTVSFLTAAICAGSAALAGAIAESLPVQLSDNLRVGLAAAVTVVVTTFLIVP